jgi:hypothetical protein
MFLPVDISVTVGGQKTIYARGPDLVGAKLQQFALRASGFREPLTAIGLRLMERIKGEFAIQGTTAYGRWQTLSEPYGSWKQKHVPGVPILIGIRPLHKGTREHPTRPQSYAPSGQMRRELLDPTGLMVDEHRMLYAPDSDIAGFHQTGTEKMPARPIIALMPAALHEYDRIMIEYLAKIQREVEL